MTRTIPRTSAPPERAAEATVTEAVPAAWVTPDPLEGPAEDGPVHGTANTVSEGACCW